MPDLTPVLSHLLALYGDTAGLATFERLRTLLDRYSPGISAPHPIGLSERDSILITYGDQVQAPGTTPFPTLTDFCEQHLAGLIGGIHVLPFYPYSSDDGFSVIDYRAVDPALGSWDDVARLGRHFRLMFDAVINHVSAHSKWFRAFLRDDPAYRDYFIVVEGEPDLSQVVRPRALPLLTKFPTTCGQKSLWTTFSDDQIDLNFRNPEVLLEIVETLLFYVAHGAEFIRLDAIAYLWKEIGTPCIHRPQTHRIIQLFRAVLDDVAPYVLLITETNVGHAENITYFGDATGTREAQLVYNFALAPLTLHAFHTGSARALSEWAAGLTLPSDRVTFLNFLASHDGIGLNPARGILSDLEIDALAERAIAHGGLVSYKHNADGASSPYELNVSYLDALSNPSGGEPLGSQINRFLAAQAIMLALVGVPGIYFHSLFGSRGWPEGVRQSGRNRTINRQKLSLSDLERELADPGSLRHRVFSGYTRLLRARAASPAFHPHGMQRVIDCGEAVFAVVRMAPGGSDREERVLCLHNVSGRHQVVEADLREVLGARSADGASVDLITGERVAVQGRLVLHLRPYQALWLKRVA